MKKHGSSLSQFTTQCLQGTCWHGKQLLPQLRETVGIEEAERRWGLKTGLRVKVRIWTPHSRVTSLRPVKVLRTSDWQNAGGSWGQAHVTNVNSSQLGFREKPHPQGQGNLTHTSDSPLARPQLAHLALEKRASKPVTPALSGPPLLTLYKTRLPKIPLEVWPSSPEAAHPRNSPLFSLGWGTANSLLNYCIFSWAFWCCSGKPAAEVSVLLPDAGEGTLRLLSSLSGDAR